VPPDILLVNPWIFDFAAYDFWMAPLGLLDIAAVVRNSVSARLHFIDCLDRTHASLRRRPQIKDDGRGPFPKVEVPKPVMFKDVPRRFSRYGISPDAFAAELARLPPPAVVLLTCTMTYWYPGVQLAVEIIRRTFGGVPVVLGGIYATLCGEHARRNSGADRIIAGPGENSVLPLLREILGGGAVREAPRRSFRDLPRSAFDLLADRRWLPVMSSRGCPFRCSFCASHRLSGGFEERDPVGVVAEIEEARLHFGTRHFAFYDDALLLNKTTRLMPILETAVRRGLDAVFHTPNGLHVREIDDAIARLFRRAGVQSIFLSQESTDPAVIASSCPKMEDGDLGRAVLALERAGYAPRDLNVYLIAGLPDQTASGIRADLRYVRRLGCRPRLAYFSPIPGTAVWDDLVRAGKIASDADPLLHNKAAFPFIAGTIDPREWESLRREAAAD